MATKTEPATLGDALKWEQDSDYSRKTVTIASGENLALCQVVGKITATGKYAALDPSAVDGTQAAAGFVIAAVDASTADKLGVIIERDALVAMNNLYWTVDIDATEKAAAIVQLEALGIKAVALA
jgi:hypothetical protein